MQNAEVFNAINGVKGCQFATIGYTADCGFPKKSGLQGIRKNVISKGVQFNYSYENAVNNRLAKQGDQRTFVAQSLPWGAWLIQNQVIENKGKYYLRYYTQMSTKTDVQYIEEDGTICSPQRVQAIKAYLATKAKPKSQAQSASGLDDNQVHPQNVSFENITYMVVNGETTSTTPIRKAA